MSIGDGGGEAVDVGGELGVELLTLETEEQPPVDPRGVLIEQARDVARPRLDRATASVLSSTRARTR